VISPHFEREHELYVCFLLIPRLSFPTGTRIDKVRQKDYDGITQELIRDSTRTRKAMNAQARESGITLACSMMHVILAI
jgi:hypothetical protein